MDEVFPYLEKVLQKVEAIGPRLSTSFQEAEFARWLEGELYKMDFVVEKEDFKALSTYSFFYCGIWGMFLGAFCLLWFSRWLALPLALFALLLTYCNLNTVPLLATLLTRRKSVNVLAKNTDSPRFVLCAHLDSARTSLFFSPRLVVSPRLSLLFNIASSVWVAVVVLLYAFLGYGWLRWLGLPASLYLLFLFVLHFHREFCMPPSPGANDNGSGVAVALELASRLQKANLPFWVLFTGAEESGTFGALHFWERHKDLLRSGVSVINLDNLGAGRLTLASMEGMWEVFASSEDLRREIKAAALEKGITLLERPYLGLSTDATVFLKRGGKAVTIIGLDERGLPPNWHWVTDTLENLHRPSLKNAVVMLEEWAKRHV